MLKLLINNVDYSQYLRNNESLNIRLGLRDYSSKFELLVPFSLTPQFETGGDVNFLRVKEGNEELIFGGLINYIEFKEETVDSEVVLAIECIDYNTILSRRTISRILDNEPDSENPELDTNTAGNLVKKLLNTYLIEEGITEGIINKGGRLVDADFDEFDTMNLRDITDTLANIDGSDYNISYDKKIYFSADERVGIVHSSHETTIQRKNGFKISVRKDLTNYVNKVFVIGDYPDEEVPEEFLNYDGKIKYVQEVENEIDRMKMLHGGTGVFGKVIHNADVVTLADAMAIADKELGLYGTIHAEAEVKTYLDCFYPRDIVIVNMPEYGLIGKQMMISELEIELVGNELYYTLHLTSQINTSSKKEDFYDLFKKITETNRKDKPKEPEIPGGPTEPEIPNLPLSKIGLWADMQDDTKVQLSTATEPFGSDSKTVVANIKNKLNDNESCFFEGSDYEWFYFRPTYKEEDGIKYMSFNFNDDDRYKYTSQQLTITGNLLAGQYKELFIVSKEGTLKYGAKMDEFIQQSELPYSENKEGEPLDKYNYYAECHKLVNFWDNHDRLSFEYNDGHFERYSNEEMHPMRNDWSTSKNELRIDEYRHYGNFRGINFSISTQSDFSIDKIREGETDTDIVYTFWDNLYAYDTIIDGLEHPLRRIEANTSNKFFIGDIAEIIICKEDLTFEERVAVKNYLMNKYNIPKGEI